MIKPHKIDREAAFIPTGHTGLLRPERHLYTAAGNLYCGARPKELIDTDDEIQRVEGLRIETRTNQIEGRLNLKDNIHKLFDDIILKALIKYGITVKMSLDIPKKKLNVLSA